ncbi:MAG TPA: type II CAAX endopeptidase family protein [Candidatus Saccharimonadales bacterium]|nr:type II CAAX endopeptidase family protein [Candidatus Saccharimonadales bacterium]
MLSDSSEKNKELRIKNNGEAHNSKNLKHHAAHKPGFGPWWLVVLVTLLIFFISQFAAALVVSAGLVVFKSTASISDLLDQSAPTQFFYVLAAEGIVIAITLLVVTKWRHLRLSAIGLGRLPKWNDLSHALVGAAAFYGLLIVTSVLLSFLLPSLNTEEAQDVGFNALNSSLDSMLAFIALVILPPIGEEILMRGYLFSGLRSRMTFVSAGLFTSLLFGLAHLGTGATDSALWIAGIDTFLLSLVLVYLRETTGALYAPMLVHAANNLIAFGVHFR